MTDPIGEKVRKNGLVWGVFFFWVLRCDKRERGFGGSLRETLIVTDLLGRKCVKTDWYGVVFFFRYYDVLKGNADFADHFVKRGL